MKDFKHWGLRMRQIPECNYSAIWDNLKTIRLGSGQASELPADRAEFYDVALGTKCNANPVCPFCYVSASKEGILYENICDTWNKWMATFPPDVENDYVTRTSKPFSIALGSTGEVTIHPEFCDFLKTIYESKVVPSYTTNGISLYFRQKLSPEYIQSAKILMATDAYCGGVAVSFGNKALHHYAKFAVSRLTEIDTNINLHHIISDTQSVDDLVSLWSEYEDAIKYHVLLPLMPSGRSTKCMELGVWDYLEEKITKLGITNVAFGAHMYEHLKTSSIKTWMYPPESLSKNMLLMKDKIVLTKSSFDLNPVKIIEL